MDPETQRLLVTVITATVTGLGGVILGHRLSAHAAANAAARENKARQHDALARREVERIERTAAFYVRLLDWHIRNLNRPVRISRLPGRPRFADEPDVNLALLAVPQLMIDVDDFLQGTEARQRSGGVLDRHTTNIHLELVDHVLESADEQITALLQGREPRRLATNEISRRLRAERVEEIKFEDPLRHGAGLDDPEPS